MQFRCGYRAMVLVKTRGTGSAISYKRCTSGSSSLHGGSSRATRAARPAFSMLLILAVLAGVAQEGARADAFAAMHFLLVMSGVRLLLILITSAAV